ncbi:Mrp/NBP35 family ATP-binding protein [Qipengyuania spongiae]|uniref:Iron-sulfur cluster carrier protein n=1 Tax=Qipengyuania spongiae TaxID=2909673 RepID=A0ABY5SZI7_9SPHN|nr:Mrp/NBP35 family ATP-binding protein [Qipengyuania spongiae]UVI39605.1 Mrp/NBP35 family ATP-binding protein [Qipengyuania spongiae]
MSDTEITASLPAPLAARVISASLADGRATIVLDVAGLDENTRGEAERTVRDTVGGRPDVEDVRVILTAERRTRRIVAVGSGKGGVGKSTLTANLAIALKRLGHSVGLVDADIYGPSQPTILGNRGQKPEVSGKKLVPVPNRWDVPVLSMGHLVEEGAAVAWRGPMAGNALTQLIDAEWGAIDTLLVDLPPGTGDVQLTMLQKFKPSGAVLVSTPQDLALIDAARAGSLFDHAGVPVIGLVENMSGYICPHCGEVSDPFGSGGVEQAAERLELPFLGRIPLALGIREASDAGTPPAARDGGQGSELAAPFEAVAAEVSRWLGANA